MEPVERFSDSIEPAPAIVSPSASAIVGAVVLRHALTSEAESSAGISLEIGTPGVLSCEIYDARVKEDWHLESNPRKLSPDPWRDILPLSSFTMKSEAGPQRLV